MANRDYQGPPIRSWTQQNNHLYVTSERLFGQYDVRMGVARIELA